MHFHHITFVLSSMLSHKLCSHLRLSMFTPRRYLLYPLQKWEEGWDSGSIKTAPCGAVHKPVLVMLVDALDEADHDNRGTLPVAHLLAKE